MSDKGGDGWNKKPGLTARIDDKNTKLVKVSNNGFIRFKA